MSDRYQIQVATPTQYLEARKLRIHVFVEIQKFPLEAEVDEYDAIATHLVLLDTTLPASDQLIGTLRIVDEPTGGYAKLGRIVVSPDHQGLGLGKLMMEEAERYIKENLKHIGCIKLGSQMDKREFYTRCGYRKVGDVFDDAGAPHIMMVKDIL